MVYITSCEVLEASVHQDYTGQTDIITDFDGNQYKSVGIGTQIWMQENLPVTHLADGAKITLLENNLGWRD